MSNQVQNLDSIFNPLSRVTIAVPIIIVLIALLLKISGNIPITQNSHQTLPSPTQMDSPTELNKKTDQSTDSAKFNLQGPLICAYNDKTASLSAYVLNKKFLLTIKEKQNIQNVLLHGDCGYIWKKNESSGEKICGMGQYVMLIEGFLSSGLIDLNSIVKNLSQIFTLPSTDISQESIKSLFNTCIKKDIPNAVQFNIPSRVLFKNKEIKLP